MQDQIIIEKPKTWTCLDRGCGQVLYSSLLFWQHQEKHKRNISFDERCYELAEHFLEDDLDTQENCRRLAIIIQQAIEDELDAIELEA